MRFGQRVMYAVTTATMVAFAGFAACTVLMAPGCGVINAASFKRTDVATLTAAGTGPVSVESANGSIELSESTTDAVEVEAKVAMTSQARLDACKILLERADSGAIKIGMQWPDGRRESNEGCSFQIKAPKGAGVTARTSNGAIKVVGLEGGVNLKTSNGRVEVTDHKGPVTIDTSNGGVAVVGAAFPVQVDTSNAKVVVGLTPEATGPLNVRTSNGSIEVDFGPQFAGSISYSTSNGSVSTELLNKVTTTGGQKSGTVTFGTGASSTLKTSNGSIRILQK